MNADSQTVVKALTEVDPGFTSLIHKLFGDTLDAHQVWEHLYGPGGVSKMNPAPPDLATPSGRTTSRIKAKKITGGQVQNFASTKQQPIAQPAAKNTAPKSAMTIKEPKKSESTMSKADEELLEVAKHAVFSGVPQERVEEIIKAGKAGAARTAAKKTKETADHSVQAIKARLKGKTAPAAVGALTGAGAAELADEINDKDKPRITYELPATPGNVTYYRGGKAADDGDDIVWAGEFAKTDDDQRLVFGWASVISINGEEVIDKQGDAIDWEELEKSAYKYMEDSRVGGVQHKRTWGPDGDAPYHAADVVESFVTTPEKIEKMGLPSSTPIGWWLGMRVNDDEAWEDVKAGRKTGFSIHGRGRRRALVEV